MQGFKKFILRGNVVDLAVGVVLGAAFNSVVSSLVKSFFTPIVAIILGNQNFSKMYFTINHVKVNFGDFLNALVSFLIIAIVVYFFVVLPMNKLQEISRRGKSFDPTTKKCPYCFSEIDVKATRCPNCTTYFKKREKEAS